MDDKASEALTRAGAAPESGSRGSQPTATALFLIFLRIGLTAFGGSTQAWTYREIVERRHWLTEQKFLSGFTVAQVLPGSNPLNVALYVGMELAGLVGAAAAACGMMIPAFCMIMLMGFLYRQFGHYPLVHQILGGVAAVGVGATLSVGLKVAQRLPRRFWSPLVAVATFIVVGLLHWPLIPVVLVAVPVSVASAYFFGSGESHAE